MASVHPYRAGYRVLPDLKRISLDDVLDVTPAERERLLKEKALAGQSQTCLVEHECSPELKRDVARFLKENSPCPLGKTESLDELVALIPEDLAIHCRDDDRDWMSYGAVFLPSGWLPEAIIGKSFHEIHLPVEPAGMNLVQSSKLVDTMIDAGPFERFVWSPIFEERLNGHPSHSKARFNPLAPHLYVKVERQVTVGFPEHDAALFLITQRLIPEPEIDKPALREALLGMTLPQRVYKAIENDFEDLVEWLERSE